MTPSSLLQSVLDYPNPNVPGGVRIIKIADNRGCGRNRTYGSKEAILENCRKYIYVNDVFKHSALSN